jgi:hypothetical protein
MPSKDNANANAILVGKGKPVLFIKIIIIHIFPLGKHYIVKSHLSDAIDVPSGFTISRRSVNSDANVRKYLSVGA